MDKEFKLNKIEIRARDKARVIKLLIKRERMGKNISGVWNWFESDREELDFLLNKHNFNRWGLNKTAEGLK